MFPRLKALFESLGLPQWRALYQSYDILESSGKSKTSQECKITIFETYYQDGRKYQGTAETFVDLGMGDEELKPLLKNLAQEARQNPDPWFPWKNTSVIKTQTQISSLGKMEPEALLESLRKISTKILGADALRPDFKIKKIETIYMDSTGRELVDLAHGAEVRFPGEPQFTLSMSEYVPETVEGFIQQVQRLKKDLSRAESLPGPAPAVLLSGWALLDALGYLLRQCSGLGLYSGQSRLEFQEFLWGVPPQGDPIGIKGIPQLYNSPYTRYFDDQGQILSNTDLIKDHRLVGAVCTQETAHYLGIPWTGHLMNFSVAPGTFELKSLRGQACLEIPLGTWTLDDMTGDFTLNADLGYLYGSGDPKPVKGLKLRGNLKTIFSQVRFTKEIWHFENYEGPEFMWIPQGILEVK